MLSTVIAVEGGCRPPANRNAPADVSSSMNAPAAAMAASRSAGSIVAIVGSSAESWGRDSRNWVITHLLGVVRVGRRPDRLPSPRRRTASRRIDSLGRRGRPDPDPDWLVAWWAEVEGELFGGLAVLPVGVADGFLFPVDPAWRGRPRDAVDDLQRPDSGVHVGVMPSADEGQVGDVGRACRSTTSRRDERRSSPAGHGSPGSRSRRRGRPGTAAGRWWRCVPRARAGACPGRRLRRSSRRRSGPATPGSARRGAAPHRRGGG